MGKMDDGHIVYITSLKHSITAPVAGGCPLPRDHDQALKNPRWSRAGSIGITASGPLVMAGDDPHHNLPTP